MKEYLKKLIKNLYYKYCDPDVVTMTRDQLGLFNDSLDLGKLSKEEQKIYRLKAKDFSRDKYLTGIMSMLVREILYDCKVGPDGQMPVLKPTAAIEKDRYSINGLSLLKEKFEELAVVTEKKPREKMDEDEQFDAI